MHSCAIFFPNLLLLGFLGPGGPKIRFGYVCAERLVRAFRPSTRVLINCVELTQAQGRLLTKLARK